MDTERLVVHQDGAQTVAISMGCVYDRLTVPVVDSRSVVALSISVSAVFSYLLLHGVL